MDDIFFETVKNIETNNFSQIISSYKSGLIILIEQNKVFIKNINDNLNYNYINL